MDLDFYNEGMHVAYPFVDSDPFMFGAGVVTLPQGAIADAGFLFGIDAEFDHDSHRVWLESIERNGTTITLTFNTDAPELSSEDMEINVDTSDAVGTTHDFTLSAALDKVHGYLVVGDLDALTAQLVNGVNYSTDTIKAPRIEPANLQSLRDSYLQSLTVYTDNRHIVTSPTGCGPAESSSPAESDDSILIGTILSGDVVFVEGYNATILVSERASSITIGAGLGYGAGRQCEEIPYEFGDLSSPGSLLTGGDRCADLLYTINGIRPDSSGRFVIEGSYGIVVTPYPDMNKIIISFELTRRILCNVG